jgi:hypothetical protein
MYLSEREQLERRLGRAGRSALESHLALARQTAIVGELKQHCKDTQSAERLVSSLQAAHMAVEFEFGGLQQRWRNAG